jgi:hypothetical protein
MHILNPKSQYLNDDTFNYIKAEREIYNNTFMNTDRKFRCDWIVHKPDGMYVVEYFGVESDDFYNAKIEEKVNLLNESKYKDRKILLYKNDLDTDILNYYFKNCIKIEGEKENG